MTTPRNYLYDGGSDFLFPGDQTVPLPPPLPLFKPAPPSSPWPPPAPAAPSLPAVTSLDTFFAGDDGRRNLALLGLGLAAIAAIAIFR